MKQLLYLFLVIANLCQSSGSGQNGVTSPKSTKQGTYPFYPLKPLRSSNKSAKMSDKKIPKLTKQTYPMYPLRPLRNLNKSTKMSDKDTNFVMAKQGTYPIYPLQPLRKSAQVGEEDTKQGTYPYYPLPPLRSAKINAAGFETPPISLFETPQFFEKDKETVPNLPPLSTLQTWEIEKDQFDLLGRRRVNHEKPQGTDRETVPSIPPLSTLQTWEIEKDQFDLLGRRQVNHEKPQGTDRETVPSIPPLSTLQTWEIEKDQQANQAMDRNLKTGIRPVIYDDEHPPPSIRDLARQDVIEPSEEKTAEAEVEPVPPHEPRLYSRYLDPSLASMMIKGVEKVPSEPTFNFGSFVLNRMNLGLLAIGTDDDDAIVISNTTTHNDNSLEYENSLEFENSNDSLERRRKKPPNMMWKNSNDCGVRDRIIGGDVGTAGEFPWLVALKLSWGYQFCGGSLIHPEWILTAAHCVSWGRDVLSIKIALGDFDLKSSTETVSIERGVSKIKIHIKYSEVTTDYDIALIKLDKPVDIVPNLISTICLPNPKEDFTGASATVAGWGYIKTGGPGSDVMKHVDVKIIPRAECQKSYGRDSITSNMICAGYPGGNRDACQGDSGGPLFISGSARTVQIGIVSWGRGCGLAEYPGIYTNIANLLDWVGRHSQD